MADNFWSRAYYTSTNTSTATEWTYYGTPVKRQAPDPRPICKTCGMHVHESDALEHMDLHAESL